MILPLVLSVSPLNLFALCRDNKIALNKTHWLVIAAVLSILLYPIVIFERFLFRKDLRNTPVAPPVFIIGHWRSGTTFLHNLLCIDPQFGYVNSTMAFVPSISLTGGKLLKRVMRKVLPPRRPMDAMLLGPESPQEEEFALASTSLQSFYHMLTFPNRAEELFKKYVLFQEMSDREVSLWKLNYEKLLKKVSFQQDQKSLLLKNPVNTARINLLLSMYPEAKFIYMHRRRDEVIPSQVKTVRKLHELTAMHDIDHQLLTQTVYKQYDQLITAFESQAMALSEDQLIRIEYKNVIDHPKEELRRIYENFGLTGFKDCTPSFEKYLSQLDGYQASGTPHIRKSA